MASEYHYTFGDLIPEIRERIKTGLKLRDELNSSVRAFLAHFPTVTTSENDALVAAMVTADSVCGRSASEVPDAE